MGEYNPASTRVSERAPGTKDYIGVQRLVFPAGSIVSLGHGTVLVDVPLSPSAGGGNWAFEPTQEDPSSPNVLTIPGTDTWVKHTIRLFWNNQRVRTSALTISGPGNRTITVDTSVPIELGDFFEGEGDKA